MTIVWLHSLVSLPLKGFRHVCRIRLILWNGESEYYLAICVMVLVALVNVHINPQIEYLPKQSTFGESPISIYGGEKVPHKKNSYKI